jgi:peptidoglycan/xylan/chitin deacetylase (PgdA/CDA1 family)
MTKDKQPMRWEHLKELSDRGHIIASHTMDHYMINTDDTNILKYQIESCKEIIEAHTGKPCECFAFPYGKLSQANQKAIDIACEKYKYVFSQSDYKHYFSFNNKVINRRHFEAFCLSNMSSIS